VSLPRDFTLIMRYDLSHVLRSIRQQDTPPPDPRGRCLVYPTAYIVQARTVMSHAHTTAIRVRYPEVDPMGYLHHSRYLQYFEIGRIELLRALGHSYADLEQQGVFFVVV